MTLFEIFKGIYEDASDAEEMVGMFRSLVSCRVLTEEQYDEILQEWDNLEERITYENISH